MLDVHCSSNLRNSEQIPEQEISKPRLATRNQTSANQNNKKEVCKIRDQKTQIEKEKSRQIPSNEPKD